MERKPQSLSNHAKFDELFHFFLGPVFLANLVVAGRKAYNNPSFDTLWMVLMAFALIVLLFRVRTYPLKVQDRVIRLEERMRLMQVLPESLRGRIGELTESQLIALRFACDAELPSLVQKALSDNLAGGNLKKLVQNWRPDYF